MNYASCVAFGLLLLTATAAAQHYVVSTYASGASPPTPVAALDVSIGVPQNLAIDAAGNLYFASLNVVFKLDRDGMLIRIAGSPHNGFSVAGLSRRSVLGGKGSVRRGTRRALASCAPFCTIWIRDGRLRREPD